MRGSMREDSNRPLLLALAENASRVPSSSCFRRVGSGRMSSLLASIFEKSRMSSMIRIRLLPDSRITRTVERCEASSEVRLSISSMPSSPFMGVRIWWLMVARKALFASLAALACSVACCAVRRSAISLRSCSLASASSSFSLRSSSFIRRWLCSCSSERRIRCVSNSELRSAVPSIIAVKPAMVRASQELSVSWTARCRRCRRQSPPPPCRCSACRRVGHEVQEGPAPRCGRRAMPARIPAKPWTAGGASRLLRVITASGAIGNGSSRASTPSTP